MLRESVESSAIVAVGYSATSLVLEVEYISGGVYQYLGVPVDEHAALMAAASKGQHVNRRIRGCFAFRRVSS